MASRSRISYHWRLFLPLGALIGVVIGVLIWYQYRREAAYREEMFSNELELINRRVIKAYENDVSLHSFLSFIRDYYTDSMYDDVRISVYDNYGMLMYSLGDPIDRTLNAKKITYIPPVKDSKGEAGESSSEGNFFYVCAISEDGLVNVKTAMPFNQEVNDAIDIDATVWLVIIFLALVSLIFTYLYTRTLSRNVRLLREFAQRASTGANLQKDYNFPHNELGDISREIVTLYRERGKAIEMINHERQVAMHAIEERMSTSRKMTNNINHEIKTPVGIIKGYLETIIANPDMDEASRTRFLQRMMTNIDRLCSLLDDISTITRLENGGSKISLECVEMHELVYQIDNDLAASGVAGNMKFSYSIPLECKVKGNYNLINGMISGLIRNAAIHSGGTEMGVRLISESERFYVFSFYDNGTGVSEEHLTHLFERFYRVDSGRSRKAGGTGLGLPIVKNTVISLGGTISVHNQSTGGLEFIFTLPKWDE